MFFRNRVLIVLLALTAGRCAPALAADKPAATGATHKAAASATATHKGTAKAAAPKPVVPKSAAAPKASTNNHSSGKGTARSGEVHKEATGDAAGFKLKASFSHPADAAVDTYRSLGAGDGAPAPVTFERKFDMLVAPKPKEESAQSDVASAKKAAIDKTAELQAAESSKVDWSGWAGQLADRWFANLKNLEYNSHRGWTTDNPAMIQFTCHADGRITNIVLRQSCGNKAYDNMQIEALKRTIPAPPFPAGTHLTSYTLIQGWEAHPRHPGEQDYSPGSFGKNMPAEKVPLKKPVASPAAAKPAVVTPPAVPTEKTPVKKAKASAKKPAAVTPPAVPVKAKPAAKPAAK